MNFPQNPTLTKAGKIGSVIGSIMGPSLVVMSGAFFLMSYAATHAWTQGANYADFWVFPP